MIISKVGILVDLCVRSVSSSASSSIRRGRGVCRAVGEDCGKDVEDNEVDDEVGAVAVGVALVANRTRGRNG